MHFNVFVLLIIISIKNYLISAVAFSSTGYYHTSLRSGCTWLRNLYFWQEIKLSSQCVIGPVLFIYMSHIHILIAKICNHLPIKITPVTELKMLQTFSQLNIKLYKIVELWLKQQNQYCHISPNKIVGFTLEI